jgi:hypothetical protein
MGLVAGFTHQTASHEAYSGRDNFGKPTFAPVQQIRVRREPAKGVSRSATGTDVAVETYYLTEALVSVQDRLDGTSVRRVKTIVDFDGFAIGTEVWV